MRSHYPATKRIGRRGFTLTELLVVVLVIVIVGSMILAAMSSATKRANEEATKVLLQIVQDALEERYNAFLIEAKNGYTAHTARDTLASTTALPATGSARAKLIWLLDRMRAEFPMEYADFHAYPYELGSAQPPIPRAYEQVYSPPSPKTGPSLDHENAECLYMILKYNQRQGMQFSMDMLPNTAIRDHDGDGFPEIVDPWGNDLRFYRWPTDLIAYYLEIEKSLPINMLTYSTLDPSGLLIDSAWQGAKRTTFEDDNVSSPTTSPHPRFFRIHAAYAANGTISSDPDTAVPRVYPLFPIVVSSGPDGVFGLVDDPIGKLSGRGARPDKDNQSAFRDDIVSLRIKTGGRH